MVEADRGDRRQRSALRRWWRRAGRPGRPRARRPRPRPRGTDRRRWRSRTRRTSAAPRARRALQALRRPRGSARWQLSSSPLSTSRSPMTIALLEALEVRRGVARAWSPAARSAAVDHRRHRALAVGAGDDDRAEAALGVAERGAEPRDVLEAELHAEALEAEQVVERIRESAPGRDGCGPAPPQAAAARRGRPPNRRTRDDHVLQLAPIDDHVEHAVLEQELAALKALGQLLADRLLDDARAGKADQRLRLGDVDVARASRSWR